MRRQLAFGGALVVFAVVVTGCTGSAASNLPEPHMQGSSGMPQTTVAEPAARLAGAERSWAALLRERAAKLNARLNAPDWTLARCRVDVNDPFVIVANVPQALLARVTEQTLKQGEQVLGRMYFETGPKTPIVVALFADDASYRTGAQLLFGDRPNTPYGYFKPAENALVINLGTGTGTLMHEMTHALLAPDFPDCPTWFNEGLASLYEQCRFTTDGLQGLRNWRLPILHEELGRVRPAGTMLTELLESSGEAFYGAKRGGYYAVARYFCFFLQDKGLLQRFYRAFRTRRQEDPTGTRFVRELFEGATLAAIEGEFRAWARSLRWPGYEPPRRVPGASDTVPRNG